MIDVLLWCFQQNYHLDKSNACVHCAPVKFSPITFKLYTALIEQWPIEEDITQEMAEIASHLEMYELDHGR
jgi:hypothetical protein